jgi:predicted  nucleic acid-binding Zn-ribbon protein
VSKAKVKDLGKALDVVSARLEHAERALAGVMGEIHATKAVIAELRARLAQTPPLAEGAAYARFAESARGSLRARLNELTHSLKTLSAERIAKRDDVERLLRQKTSLARTLDAAEMERRREIARR